MINILPLSFPQNYLQQNWVTWVRLSLAQCFGFYHQDHTWYNDWYKTTSKSMQYPKMIFIKHKENRSVLLWIKYILMYLKYYFQRVIYRKHIEVFTQKQCAKKNVHAWRINKAFWLFFTRKGDSSLKAQCRQKRCHHNNLNCILYKCCTSKTILLFCNTSFISFYMLAI